MTTDDDLAAAVASTVAEVGTWLADQQAHVTPWRTWHEFRGQFDRVDSPAGDRLRAALGRVRPGAAWVDEFEEDLPSGEFWCVDPIDGAVQYLQGLPQWSVSVTLVREGRPAVAVLHAPLLGETYAAVRCKGATRNGAPIRPSGKSELGLAVVGTSHPPFVTGQPGVAEASGRSMAAVLGKAGAVRNLGPTSWQIGDVGAGRLDAFWQFGRDAANLIGASLVAGEAGAGVTDSSGREWEAGAESFVAAAPELHAQLVETLSGVV